MASNNNYPTYNSYSSQFNGLLEDANDGFSNSLEPVHGNNLSSVNLIQGANDGSSNNNFLRGNNLPSSNLIPEARSFRPILGRRNDSMGYGQQFVMQTSSLQMQRQVSSNSLMNHISQCRPRFQFGLQQNAYYPDRKDNAEAGALANGGQICAFCVKNHETNEFARSHRLKDANGKVTCPVLRKHVCEICWATGDNAHTKTYCKYNPIGTQPIAKVLQNTERNSTGIRNKKKKYFNPSNKM